MKKVTLIELDDWQGFYIDGKLIDECSSLDLDIVLHQILGDSFENIRLFEDNLDDFGNRLPNNLEDLKKVREL